MKEISLKLIEPICLLHLMAKTKKLLEKKLNIETIIS